jgi:hypothetical protein
MMAKRRISKTLSKKGASKPLDVQLPPTVTFGAEPGQDKPKIKRGVKTPSEELSRVIEMANLADSYRREHGRESVAWHLFYLPNDLRKDRVLSTDDLLSAIMRLRDSPLRSHLLEVMNDPKEWTERETDYFDRYKPDFVTLVRRSRAVLERYHFILSADTALEMVVYGHETFPVSIGLERYVNGQGRHKPRYRSSIIAQALMSVDDLRDIRRCAVCKQFFYARRFSSAVCDPNSTCAATYSKRQERKNAVERKRLAELAERSSKKKRAKTARKRCNGPTPLTPYTEGANDAKEKYQKNT